MRIGIAGPFKPKVISDLLYPGQDIPDIHKSTTSLSDLIREFIVNGHDVTVFTYTTEDIKPMCLNGEHVKVYIISSFSSIKGAIYFSRIYMINRIKTLIEKEIENLDILHAHWTYDYAMAARKFKNKIPVCCTVRDWCPKVIKMQNSLPNLLYWIVSWVQNYIVIHDSKINLISNSEYIRDMIEHSCHNRKVPVIYNCIDLSIVKDNSFVNERPVFISISQSIEYKLKNIERLVEAHYIFHIRHSNSVLKLVGSGFEATHPIAKNWERRGWLDGVELCGYVNHDDMLKLIDSSTCLVHPSLEESFGNTLIEGMARCRPVIGGWKSGAVPYVLEHGKAGFLCDVTDVQSICDTMEVVANGGERVLSTIAYAKSSLFKRFDLKEIYSYHIGLYNDILSSY